jgi:hypothetical protein
MKCPRCQKEISESGSVYCPHCGKKLKPSQGKVKGIFSWHLVAWPALTWVILSGICYWLDKQDPAMMFSRYIYHFGQWMGVYKAIPGNPLEWAVEAWVTIAAGILYIIGIWIIYHHAKRYNRNAVRWTTAAIVFFPVLAWIVYGLTWRARK